MSSLDPSSFARPHALGLINPATPCVILTDSSIAQLLPSTFTLPRNPASKQLFEVKESAHGLAVYAAKDIHTGTVITVDQPVVIEPEGLMLRRGGMTRGEVTKILFSQLPPAQREAALTLCNSMPNGTIEEGIMITNGIQINLPVPEDSGLDPSHTGLFVNASRFNHSCSPNTIRSFNLESFSLAFHASRPISKGEEITTSYIYTLLPRAERRAELQNAYQFQCTCSSCILDDGLSKESDERRGIIGSWDGDADFAEVMAWGRDDSLSEKHLIDRYLERMALVEVEGVQTEGLESTLSFVVQCYAMLGDRDQFLAWGKRLQQIQQNDELLDSWMEKPEKYPVWAQKKIK